MCANSVHWIDTAEETITTMEDKILKYLSDSGLIAFKMAFFCIFHTVILVLNFYILACDKMALMALEKTLKNVTRCCFTNKWHWFNVVLIFQFLLASLCKKLAGRKYYSTTFAFKKYFSLTFTMFIVFIAFLTAK